MVRDEPQFAMPDWKPRDAENKPERAPEKIWNMLNTGTPLRTNAFAYMDRIGPEMFVGRYNHGKCGAARTDAGECDRRHAYIVTITPDGAESVCIYCSATLDGCPKAKIKNIPWDEPYDGPRRATKRELEAMQIDPIPEHRMLYLDDVDGKTCTGRFRVGECPAGGPHEAVMQYWNYERDARQSFCAFCGEFWVGSPPGFWEVTEPDLTVEKVLEEHAEAVRRGTY